MDHMAIVPAVDIHTVPVPQQEMLVKIISAKSIGEMTNLCAEQTKSISYSPHKILNKQNSVNPF